MVGNQLNAGETSRFPAVPMSIGPVSLPNRVILAPMSGITDAPFRRLAERLGAGLVVSEMTACAALAQGKRDAYEDFDQAAGLERRGRPDRAAVSTALERVQGPMRRVLNNIRNRPVKERAR